MEIITSDNPKSLGEKAGKAAGELISKAIEGNGSANIILATGTSQFETINQLLKEDIEWGKVTMFHLDEYIGLPITHGASFRKYLKERFLNKVGNMKGYYLIDGEVDPIQETKRLGRLIEKHPIDVALVGIGENGHLAFNDPPADFETEEPYLIVDLDQACRAQQLNEGWFPNLDAVPAQAISMSIRQIMKSNAIICSVPDERKAKAVRDCLKNPVSNLFPASILQEHKSCKLYLDPASASLIV